MQQLRSGTRLGSRAEWTAAPPARRIRHQARGSLLVAGGTLSLSVGAAGLFWVLGWWLA